MLILVFKSVEIQLHFKTNENRILIIMFAAKIILSQKFNFKEINRN